jgi:hypothetical protein
VPKSKLPSSWVIDRSNSAKKESFKREEEWENNSKSWDSQSDMFMNRIQHNLKMICNLTYKIEELKELIEKLIKTHHHHRRSNSSLVLASPWLVPSLGECRGITSLPFTH